MSEIFGSTTTTPINPDAFSGGGSGDYVEKAEGNGMTDEVYAVDSIGTQKTIGVEDTGMYEVGGHIFGYAIPLRKLNGNLMTRTPETELDCANKKYVDDKLGDIEILLGGI